VNGKLISFEGGEGSGKSTQARLLAEYLKKNNVPSLATREPGGTETAEKIREILVTGKMDKMDRLTEVLLHYSARNEHISKAVLPALQQGKIVVTDRFYDSTYAYQGYGHGVDIALIDNIHRLVVGELKPTMTFLFDIDVEKGLARSGKRHIEQDSGETRYESLPTEFHQRLRDGFLAIAKAEQNRFVVLNAEEKVETLHEMVLDCLQNRKIL